MPSHRKLGNFLAVLAAFTVACTAGDESDSSHPPPIRRDSAGISIVENAAPSWQQGGQWQIDSLPEVTIGSSRELAVSPSGFAAGAPEEVLLWRVQAVEVLPDGRIAVADHGRFQVKVFDSSGALVNRFVQQGEGPGELTGVLDLHRCAGGDSIVAVGRRHILVFDDQGGFARQAQYGSGTIEAVSTTCERILTQERVSMPPLDSRGLTEDVFAWVDPVSQAVDTVTRVGLLEGWTRRLYGAARPSIVPWGTSRRSHAVDEDVLVVGYGRIPELRAYDSAGMTRSIVRWSPEPVPITREDRQRYSDVRTEWLEGMPPNEPETGFLFPALDEYPELPPHKPLFDRVLVDDEGGWWVRSFPEGSFGLFDLRLQDQPWPDQTWTVFDSAGVWLGDLSMPEQFDLRAVARGRLFGVARDSLDVETVQVFRILKRSGQPP